MNLIAVSALGWRNNRLAALGLIHAVLAQGHESMTTLDTEAIHRTTGIAPTEFPFHAVPLDAWLKKGTDGYVVDYPAVHSVAMRLAPDAPVILDGTGYPASAVREVLLAARQAWFSLDAWHPGFVLVCDDALLLDLSDDLLDAFYIRPTVLTSFEAVRLAKHIQKRATIARWFGAKAARIHGLAYRVWSVAERLLTKNTDKQFSQAEKWKHG